MSVDGNDGHRRAEREEGGHPAGKRQIDPGCGGWTDWRGTGLKNLSRDSKFSGTNRDRKEYI